MIEKLNLEDKRSSDPSSGIVDPWELHLTKEWNPLKDKVDEIVETVNEGGGGGGSAELFIDDDTIKDATDANGNKYIYVNTESIVLQEAFGGSGSGISINPSDPYILTDHFLKNSTEQGEVGELGWNFNNGSVGNGYYEVGHKGIIERISGTTANQSNGMFLSAAGGIPIISFAEVKDITFVLALTSIAADFTFRAGLFYEPNFLIQQDGFYIERLSTDTNFYGVARAAANETRVLLAAQSTNWFKVKMRYITPTSIGFSFNDGVEQVITTNIPAGTSQGQWGLQVIPTSTNSRGFKIDYFSSTTI